MRWGLRCYIIDIKLHTSGTWYNSSHEITFKTSYFVSRGWWIEIHQLKRKQNLEETSRSLHQHIFECINHAWSYPLHSLWVFLIKITYRGPRTQIKEKWPTIGSWRLHYGWLVWIRYGWTKETIESCQLWFNVFGKSGSWHEWIKWCL